MVLDGGSGLPGVIPGRGDSLAACLFPDVQGMGPILSSMTEQLRPGVGHGCCKAKTTRQASGWEEGYGR